MQHQPSGRPCAKQCPIDHGTSSCWWCISSPRTPSPRTWLPTDGPIGITFGWCRANIIPNVVLEVHHDPTTIGALIWVLIGPLILRKFFWYLTTVVTSIWFLTCMTSNMNTQLPLCDKWLTTVVTSIWLLSSMSPHMFIQYTLMAKWLTTVVTRKWFLSSMSSNMALQISLSAKMTYHRFHKHMVSLPYEF